MHWVGCPDNMPFMSKPVKPIVSKINNEQICYPHQPSAWNKASHHITSIVCMYVCMYVCICMSMFYLDPMWRIYDCCRRKCMVVSSVPCRRFRTLVGMLRIQMKSRCPWIRTSSLCPVDRRRSFLLEWKEQRKAQRVGQMEERLRRFWRTI